jgi:hypothetical protein
MSACSDAALHERVCRLALAAALAQLTVELARLGVVTEVVERHHQVELRLGVVRVEHQRSLEPIARERERALTVSDHTEHVEDVRQTIGVFGNLAEQRLCLVVLAFRVVFAAEQEQLFDMVVHGFVSVGRTLNRTKN